MPRSGRACVRVALLGVGVLALPGGCRPRPAQPTAPARLVVLLPSLPDTPDPFQAPAGPCDLVFFNVFEPFASLAPSGAVEPALATSWDSRPDELSLRLKSGVRFSDGTPLDSAQAARILEAARLAGSPFATRLADLSEVRAESVETLVLRASKGHASLPHSVADVPIAKPAPGGIPAGTGPYRVTAFTAGESATLQAVEGEGPAPALRQIAVRRFRGPDDVLKELLGDEPPLVVSPPPEALAVARSHAGYRIVTQPGNDVLALVMDLGRDPTPGVGLPRNPFRKPQVRRALRLALDLEALRKGVEGGALAATQMAPPSTFGFDPGLEPARPRIDEARALLREAGLAKGFEVRLDLARENEALGRSVASQLETVGIRLKLNPLAAKQLPGVMEDESSLALASWSPGIDPAPALRAGMHSRALDRGFGDSNWTGYSDAQADRGIEAALAASDPTQRREALRATLRRLAEDSPWVPLVVPITTLVLPAGLTYPARGDGRIWLAGARLEPQPTPTPPGRRPAQPSEKRAGIR